MKLHKRITAFLLVVALGAGVTLGAVGSTYVMAQTEEQKKAAEKEKVDKWKEKVKDETAGYEHGIEVRPDFSGKQSEYNAEVDKDHNIKPAMIRYRTFTIKNKVNYSNLFIGTWLISMKALTEEYYTLARKTQKQDDQNIDLYKSEQAQDENKLWADISETSSIKNITISAEGKFFSDEEIGNYWISVVVGEDGIPRDPATGEPVDAFGNPNIYDYLNLPELAPIKKLYDEIQNKANPTDVETQHAFLTEAALVEAKGKHKDVTNGRNELTDRCDKVLTMLQFGLYKDYQSEEKKEEAKQVLKLLQMTDATRRAEIYRFLGMGNADTEARLTELSNWIKNGDDYSGNIATFTPMQEYLDAINQSIAACKASQAEHNGNALHTGVSVMAQEKYERYFLLQDQAITDNNRELEDMLVTGLIDLENIVNENVVEKERELYEDEICLLPQANDISGKLVLKELGKDFWEAMSEGKDADSLTAMMQTEIETLKNAVAELQSFITAKKDRVETEVALEWVHDVQLKWAIVFRGVLLQAKDENGEYSNAQKEKIREYRKLKQNIWDAHIRWLQDLIDKLSALLNKDGTSSKVEEYEKKRNDALEDDDPNAAKKYSYLIDKETGKNQKGTGSEVDTSKYTNDLNNMSLKDATDGLKNALGKHPSDAKAIAGAMAAAGDQNGLEDALNTAGGNDGNGGLSDEEKGDLRNEAADNSDKNGDGSDGDGSDEPLAGSGLDSGAGGDLTADDLLKALLDFLGADSFASLGADVKGAMVCALNQFGREYQVEAALELARRLLYEIMEEKNPLVYHKYTEDSYNEYVSFGGIDRAIQYTKYRYVFKNGKETMTQVPGSGSYRFEPMGTEGERSDGQKAELQMALGSMTDSYVDPQQSVSFPYMDEIDAKKYLDVRAEYIIETDWAVCVTESMEKQIKDFLEVLKQLFNPK